MSNYTSPLDYEIAVLLRESGYQGMNMTYGAAMDWIAEQKGVLVWVEYTGARYFARVSRKHTGRYYDTWKEAMNFGIQSVLKRRK